MVDRTVCQLERRVHRLRHFAESTQLLHRLRKLATARLDLVCAQLDLLLQTGIGFLQTPGHIVELVGKRLQFVARLDRDALVEIATADARGARPQCLDRADHAAGEKHPGEDRKAECGQQHKREPLQSRVKRRIRLLGWQLHEDQPIERHHGRIGGEDLMSFDVLAFLDRLGGAVAAVRHRGPRAPGPAATCRYCAARD